MREEPRNARAARQPRRPSVSRRGLVGAGVGAAGIAAIGGSARPWQRLAAAQAVPGTAAADDIAAAALVEGAAVFVEPEVRSSVDGVLDTTLSAEPDLDQRPGRMSYDGGLPGPTLRLSTGETLRVRLDNGLGGQITNLHTHGLHVSPSGNSDNVFVHVEPGESFQYEFAIPEDHTSGLYWYHPHHHGNSMQQVAGGMAGAIVIDGAINEVPGIAGLRERLLVLQGPFFGDDGIEYLVNGIQSPAIAIRPGERQWWRILNANANGYYLLSLSGHDFDIVSLDGNPLPVPWQEDTILIGPGERVGVLIEAAEVGQYQLRSLAWGEGGQQQDEFLLATMVVMGEPVATTPLPETVLSLVDLSDAVIDQRRTVSFEINSTDPYFTIDGQAFDPDRVDQTVRLGATEEWVLRNESDEWHPFHIHVNDFQVMSVNGEPVPLQYNDTVSLPPQGEVVIRLRFLDFTGKFVYHCHILAHEDFGMMGVIEVVAEDGAATPAARSLLAAPRG